MFVTERRGHARELAAGAVARGARLIVAWGGDGTVNEVASSLAFGQTPLGIVPSGSGNGLARDLGVAPRPEDALRRARSRRRRGRSTPASSGGRLFFNLAGVGFDAHVAACFDRDATGSRGLSSYVRITVRELVALSIGDYRIDAAAARRDRQALLVTFANGSQFGNGARIAPDARLDDGKLDLVVFEESSRLRTFAALPRLFDEPDERDARLVDWNRSSGRLSSQIAR